MTSSSENLTAWNKSCRALVERLERIACHAAETDEGFVVTSAFGAFACTTQGAVFAYWDPEVEQARAVETQLSQEQLKLVQRLARRDDDRRRKQALMRTYALLGQGAFFQLGTSEAIELRELLDLETRRERTDQS